MFDYRKIIRSRMVRMRILSLFSFVPDKFFLKLQYFLQTGKRLNLKSPKKFNEYIQIYKLKYHNPEMHKCVDKYEVRNYIKERGLEELLIPLYSVYDNADDVKLNSFPNKFVIKTSDGAGGNEVLICRDKNKIDEKDLKIKLRDWMKFPRPKKHIAREWAYQSNYPRKIIVEELIENPEGDKEIEDYKFFCFNSVFKCLWIDKGRFTDHKRGFWDENLNFLPDVTCGYTNLGCVEELPENINQMIRIAEKLAKGFPFARIDLYNVKGKIYFSEITFYPNSGYFPYKPESFELELGHFMKDALGEIS